MSKARHDRLLAALIAKLPAERGQWPQADRVAWLRMMAMAFDVVYGAGGGIRVSLEHAPGDDRTDQRTGINGAGGANAMHHAPAVQQASPSVAQRFYVDRDGFAMGDGRPVAMEDLPAGAILWDERVGLECGDAAAILWRDIGATRRSLPPGVTLRPVFDES
jgi:hypothetical protein